MGFDMTKGYEHQKAAVESGSWILYRFDPRRANVGRTPCRSIPRSRRSRWTIS